MRCPKCNSLTEVVSQFRVREAGKDKTRSPTVYYCRECNYHLPPIDYEM